MPELLLLVVVANSVPVLARDVLGERGAWPVDAGRCFVDGRPLLGRSKTWRGLLLACAGCAGAAPLLGLGWRLGLAAGALAMAGDLLASFCKRRLGIAASGRALLLDSVPEALLPALILKGALGLGWTQVALVPILFTALVWVASPVLYRLHLRRHPW